jgi:hypothetical protein
MPYESNLMRLFYDEFPNVLISFLVDIGETSYNVL